MPKFQEGERVILKGWLDDCEVKIIETRWIRGAWYYRLKGRSSWYKETELEETGKCPKTSPLLPFSS